MKKIVILSLLLCCSITKTNDEAASSSDKPNVNSNSDHVYEENNHHAGGGGLPKAEHNLHFHGDSKVFPYAQYEHIEPSTKNIIYSGEARIIQVSDKSAKELIHNGARGFLQAFCQLLGQDVYLGMRNWIFPNEEKEMKVAIQKVQIRQAEQQLDAEKEQIKILEEIRANIATIRKLDEKLSSGAELSEHEQQQKQNAQRSLALMQALVMQYNNNRPAQAA